MPTTSWPGDSQKTEKKPKLNLKLTNLSYCEEQCTNNIKDINNTTGARAGHHTFFWTPCQTTPLRMRIRWYAATSHNTLKAVSMWSVKGHGSSFVCWCIHISISCHSCYISLKHQAARLEVQFLGEAQAFQNESSLLHSSLNVWMLVNGVNNISEM